MEFSQFFEILLRHGLTSAIGRNYGLVRAIVTDNKDPEVRGRIQVHIPESHMNAPIDRWIDGSFPGAGDQRGMFQPPYVGDVVFVSLDEGNYSKPLIYFGGWYAVSSALRQNEAKKENRGDVPLGGGYGSTGYPDRPIWRTRAGHAISFNDEPGKESVTITHNIPDPEDIANTNRSATALPGSVGFLNFDSKGSFSAHTKSGHTLRMDEENQEFTLIRSNGPSKAFDALSFTKSGAISLLSGATKSSISVSSSGDISITAGSGTNVNVSGSTVYLNAGSVILGANASFSAVLGERLITWLNTHGHGTGTGPSSPPLIPADPSMLSSSVRLK